ncbi:MAG: BamA/TamA family outer membrane protein [Bacteroidota bacterium]|nr:BamA/TamA family outer membrane protein [Bacteroidota bacterium]
MGKNYIKAFQCIFIINIIFCNSAFSQNQFHADSTSCNFVTADSPKIKQVDILDVIKKTFGNKNKDSVSTKKERHFAILPAVGYSVQTGFAVAVGATGTFYPYKNPEPGNQASTMLASITYSQYNQFIFPLQTSIWTKKSKYNFILDWRFMEYPSTTFGLGGKSKLSNGYTIDFNYIKLHQSVMRKVSKNFYAGLGFYYDTFWNVQEIGVDSNVKTSFQKYGFQKKVTSAGVAIKLQYDSRDNQINPHTGFFASITFRPNKTWTGSDNNWNSLVGEYRGYFHLTPTTKNILAIWSYNWLTLGKGKPPYLLLPSTGWDDFFNTGRGYIQGRFRGKDMIYLETEYRFGITQNGLLGGVVFANTQSFSSTLSKQLRLFTPAFGAGARIKLNKLTGANLCLDYGFGIDGSKGLSVNLGEVF